MSPDDVNRQLDLIGLLNSTPAWATGGEPIASPPDSPETFGNFAGGVAGHFAGRIAGYELWNEENSGSPARSGPQQGFFDALAFHPYLFTSNTESRFFTGKANSPLGLYNQLRQTMAANGDGGKQIWATKFGEATSKVDEATQTAWIGDFIRSWRGLA